MKGKKIIRLLIILVVLSGVFVVVKFTGNSGRSKSFRSSLVEIDTARVSKVEILSPTDTTVLEKSASGWTVNKRKKAEESSVKALMNNLQQIQPSRLASRSEESWKDFQVDTQGTRVVAYEGKEKALDIILGRFNVEGQRSFYSYVRLSEENDVYVARDFMKMSVGIRSADYRNDDVLKLEKDSVASIAFNYPDSAFTLVKSEQGWIIGESLADSASVAKYLQSVRFVTSRNFTEPLGKPALYDVTYQMRNGENLQVTSHGNGEVSSSFNPDEYWADPQLAEKIFKGRGEFQ